MRAWPKLVPFTISCRPAVPAGTELGTSGGTIIGGPITVMLSARALELLQASVTVGPKEKVPAVVGVPEIDCPLNVPVGRESPPGNEPD